MISAGSLELIRNFLHSVLSPVINVAHLGSLQDVIDPLARRSSRLEITLDRPKYQHLQQMDVMHSAAE